MNENNIQNSGNAESTGGQTNNQYGNPQGNNYNQPNNNQYPVNNGQPNQNYNPQPNNQYPPNGNMQYQQYQNPNQQYQQPMPQQSMPNVGVNMNVNGGVAIEKKGELGKIGLILILLGLVTCGITSIPGIICSIIAFAKDKHNATNIAAMVLAVIEIAIVGLIILSGGADKWVKNNTNINDGSYTAQQVIFIETKEENGKQIYNNNGIEIYFNGLNSDTDFKFFVKNNSDKDIRVECDKLLLNGYDFTSSLNLKVTSGTKGNGTIGLSLYKMTEQDLEPADLNSLEGNFTIYDITEDEYSKKSKIDTFEMNIK